MRPLILALLVLASVRTACGHPMPNSAIVLRLHSSTITAELTLPLGELALGWDKPLPPDPVNTVRQYGEELKHYVRSHIHALAPDGRAWTVTVGEVTPVVAQSPDVRVSLTMTPPAGAPVDHLTLHYDAIFHHLITHMAVVTLASDWSNGVTGEQPVVLGTLRDTDTTMEIDRSGGTWVRGFASMFRLGMRHIAEGTDHLFFLLALILPAPLLNVDGRWRGDAGGKIASWRVVKVVTAFTIGHSVTLVCGALGWVSLPAALIESAIAVSILVSAVNAVIPIFHGREVFIAAGFGLVHGLAFASTISDFGLDPLTLVSSVLGFNLGIEAFQILIILVTMPWLVLLARSRVYGPIRLVGATLIGIAATAWLAERAFRWDNPIGPLVESAASHAVWFLGVLVALTIAVNICLKNGTRKKWDHP